VININNLNNNSFVEEYVLFASMFKWLFLSSTIGVLAGAITSLFIKLIDYGCSITCKYNNYFLLLPLALFLSSFIIIKLAPDAKGHGTEKAIEAVNMKEGKMNIKVVPVKIITTFITIVFGGSVGEEGPATQIGAAVGSFFSDLLKLDDKDRKRLVVCGIGAGFVGVFGAPIGAAIFACEVLYIGKISYNSLLPSIISTFFSYFTGKYLGTKALIYYFIPVSTVSAPKKFLYLVIFGIVIGIFALIFIKIVEGIEKAFNNINIYAPLKGIIGGLLIILIVYVTKSKDYIGIGEEFISKAISGNEVNGFSFFIKTITTSLTLGSGGSGGILTPMLFTGATLGNVWASIINANLSLYSAIGMVSFLAACANTPLAGIVISMELFGSEVGIYASIVCVIGYLIVGHRSIYPTQLVMLSKSPSIDINVNCEIKEVKEFKIKNKFLKKFINK
jgi:H+/Cl- antiporter ClcA